MDFFLITQNVRSLAEAKRNASEDSVPSKHKQACCAGCRRLIPRISKFHLFSTLAVTFDVLWELESPRILEALYLSVWVWRHQKYVFTKGHIRRKWRKKITTVFLEQPLAWPGSFNYMGLDQSSEIHQYLILLKKERKSL